MGDALVGQLTNSIRVVYSQADLEKVFRFRYKIYVEEMGLKQQYADHERKRIQDPLDATAINIAAFQGTEVVGVARINYVRNGGLDYYIGLYRLNETRVPLESGCFVTRLMLAPRLRSGTVAARICSLCYDIALRDDIRFCYIDCQPHLMRFFGGLGFDILHEEITHKEYGKSVAMRLDLHDGDRFASVKSPFLRSWTLWNNRRRQQMRVPMVTPAIGEQRGRDGRM